MDAKRTHEESSDAYDDEEVTMSNLNDPDSTVVIAAKQIRKVNAGHDSHQNYQQGEQGETNIGAKTNGAKKN